MEVKRKLSEFLKRETVLTVAILLAIVSAVMIPPDREYAGYIDFRTLSILFCLMTVMAGLQKLGVFRNIAKTLLRHTQNTIQLAEVLVLLCFFFSMIITNDVSLITFVPYLHCAAVDRRRSCEKTGSTCDRSADDSCQSGKYADADRKSAESVFIWENTDVRWNIYTFDAALFSGVTAFTDDLRGNCGKTKRNRSPGSRSFADRR